MENTTDTQEPQKETSENVAWKNIMLAFIATCAIIALFWTWLRSQVDKSPKIYKGKLMGKYNVDPKTFAKWMELLYFKGDEAKFKEYTQKKKISENEADRIIKFLGERTKETPIMSKGRIIKLRNGSYKTLRNTISDFSLQIGITMEVYDALDTFPPKLVQSILERY